MPVSLTKGGNVSLTKIAPSLQSVRIGLGWDARTTDGTPFDLDATALVCGPGDRVLSDQHFIFYNNLASPEGTVRHTGDIRDGAVAGDDEVLEVALSQLTPQTDKVVFSATIHDADSRGQNFGQVKNAYIRVLDIATNEELARYDLSEDASTETAMVFGELYRHGAEWKFRAIGQGYASGLQGIITTYGVTLA
ncbi:TerD family protein [Nocardioides litoris]|uniref:TerD family protein n=1 Tax=Nocardioides litoris TaxID=1926648 RepID=UPI0011248376|nr:TerD family protein [Nocardioides litoris]